MPTIIRTSDHNALAASLNSLLAIENKGAATLAAVNTGDVIRANQFAALQAAVNRLESSFSGNCCQSVNSNCCQSCQSSVNCSYTCQSCQRCQSQCYNCNCGG